MTKVVEVMGKIMVTRPLAMYIIFCEWNIMERKDSWVICNLHDVYVCPIFVLTKTDANDGNY